MSKHALVEGNLPTVVHINAGTIPVPPQDQVNGGLWYSIQPATSPGAGEERARAPVFLERLTVRPGALRQPQSPCGR